MDKLVELRQKADELVKAYNDAYQAGNFTDVGKLDEQIQDTVNEYAGEARKRCFDALKETDDPMLEAVKMMSYPVIGVKDVKEENAKIPIRSVIEKDKDIDLLRLHKHCGGIGHDVNWPHVAQKLNFLLTAQKCRDLGVDPKSVNDSYAMSEIARQFDMGKTPTSKTGLLKSLQMVITAMLGDGYKATSHDVAYLLSVYSKKGKAALAVSCANHRFFVNYMMRICYRVVTPGAAYSVEFKAKKD